jgi:hypothetical protein
VKARTLAGACACTLLAANYGPPEVAASFNLPDLTESSGLAASRRHPGVIWTHNDSGHAPHLFALTVEGDLLGRWTVGNARMIDWEALAIGPGPIAGASYLYVGDIGDNLSRRQEIVVYRLREPNPRAKPRTVAATALRFRYPDGAQDAEALAVHPFTGDLYVVTKARALQRQTRVFKASPPFQPGKVRQLEHVATVSLDASLFSLFAGLVTDAAIAPDGRRVVLCSYTRAWEATLPDEATSSFDEIWNGPWDPLDAGDRPHGEAISYAADGKELLLSSEGALFELIRVRRR